MEDSSAPLPSEIIKKQVITPMHSQESNNLENSSNSEDSGNFTPFDPNKPKKIKNRNKIEVLKKDDKTDLKFKIIVVGNSGVGKSCLSLRATEDVFKENHQLTIATSIYNFKVKINDKAINLQIWDTCGQEIYRSLIKNFYRNSSLAIIVYSIDKKNSFKDINLWIKEIRVNSSPDIKIVLIGNKSDLDKDRQVSYEEGKKYLDDDEVLKFFETSAKTGENIKKLFQEISIILYKDYKYFNKGNLTRSSGSFKAKKADLSKKKSKCC